MTDTGGWWTSLAECGGKVCIFIILTNLKTHHSLHVWWTISVIMAWLVWIASFLVLDPEKGYYSQIYWIFNSCLYPVMLMKLLPVWWWWLTGLEDGSLLPWRKRPHRTPKISQARWGGEAARGWASSRWNSLPTAEKRSELKDSCWGDLAQVWRSGATQPTASSQAKA